MLKPITVARQELIDTIVSNINESGLPMFVILDILSNLHRQVRTISEGQYQQDLQAWEEVQKKGEAENIDEGGEEV